MLAGLPFPSSATEKVSATKHSNKAARTFFAQNERDCQLSVLLRMANCGINSCTVKTHLRSQHALTRIELLVGIAVIVILMALIPANFSCTKITARRAKAATVVKDIANACKNYAIEYGHFPAIEAAKGGSEKNRYLSFGDIPAGKCKVDNSQLFDVLRAIPRAGGANAADALNPNKQKYFEQPIASDPKSPRDGFADGTTFPAAIQGQLFDPWGEQYCIILDADGDGVIDMKEFFSDLTGPEHSVTSAAAAFSMAKDGQRGGKGYEGQFRKPNSTQPPDDEVSWE